MSHPEGIEHQTLRGLLKIEELDASFNKVLREHKSNEARYTTIQGLQ